MSFPKIPWTQQTNVYEVNVRQYTAEGNFSAFRDHMPRLQDMGVDTLWFMPITPISQHKRKGSLGSYYACSDYVTVNPEFGTIDEFRELVQYAHSLGMKVIIDWVANHTGADHVWTQRHPDFYLRDAQNEFYDRHGWDDVIDLDYSNPSMRAAMMRSMEFWVNTCDIDGFRCDMAMLVPVDFWREARRYLDRVKPLFWLAECDQWDNPDYLEVFDAAYAWKWMHVSHDYVRFNLPIHQLVDTLYAYNGLHPRDAMRAWFTSNHDENSWNGTEYEKYGPMAIPLAVFSCTWNGIPLIYSGQELPSHKRLAFFDKDVIEWNSEMQLHDLYRQLLSLRKTHSALRAADPDVSAYFLHTEHPDKVICYVRRHGEREVVVMLNFSQWPLSVRLWNEVSLAQHEAVFPVQVSNGGNPFTVELPAWGYGVWTK